MYKEIKIKLDSYESFFNECENAGLVVDGLIVMSSHNHAMNIIGDLYKPTGNMLTDNDGNEYQEKAKLDGYHVDIRYKDTIGLEHLSCEVKNPLFKWA